ncbi:histidinol-phosphate transaminase [Phycicoccus flavus]|uniref:histidinol-phosphate transaminase n=1 Tax=Phycicoccus flavus TaxID=2502783 RepID=UPI000FEBA360|nr:histidinol-phosphate transaminase [Phycicoccus flavus]NHA67433.1 histidinol-phosphate transaminase [Phycicoccus flavus]
MTEDPLAEAGVPAPPVRLRGALDTLPAYTPGRPATVREGLTAYKISSNENPYPPLPSVLDAVREAAAGMNRYPDMAVATLTTRIAAHLGVPPERISTGPGSVGVLDQLVRATCDDGDEVVFAWRSFEAYPILVTLAGARPVMVPLAPGARHDLDAMADAVTDRTRMVLVCTPNNPTGTTVGAAELEAFLDRVPQDVLVVLDEAYVEFVDAPDAPDALAVHAARENVVVLRTFSKAYGLAGLRVGYAVAHEPVAEALRKAALPFGVNTLAQVAAVSSLEAGDELVVRVKDLVAERERTVAALREQGWEIPDQQANFVWLDLGEDTAAFAEACDAEGLTVRPYLTDGVRATVAEPEANNRLVEVAGRFLADHPR